MPGELTALDPELLVRLSDEVVRALNDAREELDALNVFPVPDGDTGTNLFLTFEEAHRELVALTRERPEATIHELTTAYARALLFAARGNSGVIMSQLCGAMVRRTVEGTEELPEALAAAMAVATDAAYAAVGEPVEGTMLTVAKAATEAARVAAKDPEASVATVLRCAGEAATDALERTPQQLSVLRRAGVVDAGGRGLCVVLEAIETALTGRRPLAGGPQVRRPIPMPMPTGDLTPEGPCYEVMYLLDADDQRIAGLRETLQGLGDSLVVVGGDGVWNVHVHVDDVGAAIEAGIDAGRPYRVRVTHFAEQVAKAKAERRGRSVVAAVVGDGLAEVFRQAGARVVSARATEPPSTEDLYAAIVATGAAEVILLPNDRKIQHAAEAAARRAEEDHGLRVAVIPSTAQVQGLAALAVHEPGRAFDQDLVEMTAAARHARSGGITVADKQAITTAGPCEPGDILGVIEGDFAVVGGDRLTVACEVLDRMLGGGGELVTIVAGPGCGDLAEACASYVESGYAHVDVVRYDGGQDRYPLLFGVE